MKTSKLNKTRILPFMAILFSMILVPELNVHGQDIKGKKGQPDVKIDVRREYDEDGNISRYDSSYSFSWSYDGSMDMDSLFESMRKNYSISPFREDDFFNMPFRNHDHFFMFPYQERDYPENNDDTLYEFIHPFDMRSMLENHRRMMEEMHRFFEFNMPCDPIIPDSIPQNHLKQRYLKHSKPL